MVVQVAGALAAGDEPEATSLVGATAHLRLRAPVRLVVLAAKDLPALAGLRKNLPGNVELLGVGRNLEASARRICAGAPSAAPQLPLTLPSWPMGTRGGRRSWR